MDGLYLKEWLKNKGKSQQWLADELGVTFSAVNRWTNGRGAISPAFRKIISRMMEADAPQDAPESPAMGLSEAELATAAQSIGKSSKELIRGILYHVSDKLTETASSEEKEK